MNEQGLGFVDSLYLSNLYKSMGFDKYETAVLTWFSTTETVKDQTDSYLDSDWTAILTECEKLGNSVEITTGTEDIYNNPYPDYLRPLTNYSFLKTATNITLVNIHFKAFNVLKSGSSQQVSGVYDAITASLGTLNNAYVQTRFMNAMPVTWQPNFFRPKFIVNGENILSNYSDNFFKTQNRADMSIGDTLPLEINLYKTFKDPINKIEVRGIVGQLIDTGSKTYINRSALYARAFLTYIKS